MTDRVALSVQASQDQQKNSVKHPETVSLFVYFKLYVYTLSGSRQSPIGFNPSAVKHLFLHNGYDLRPLLNVKETFVAAVNKLHKFAVAIFIHLSYWTVSIL